MCLAALAAMSIPATTYAADSPHSRASIGSIFTEVPGQGGGASPAGRPEADPSAKPINLARVVELFVEAGLEAAIDGENTASLKLQHSRWTFPVVISMDQDREKVRLEMLLTELEGQPALAGERLLGLLGSNLEIQPAFFSFSDKRKRIELIGSLPNSLVTAESLREELSRLAGISERTASLWEVAGASTAPTAGPAAGPVAATPNNLAVSPPTQAPTQAPAQTSGNSNVVGKWSASRSQTEAFAMQLSADGSFVLVFVKDGKQSRSTGKFTLGGNLLSLTTTDGGKFTGQLANITARSFEFTPQGGKATKLTFQKAS